MGADEFGGIGFAAGVVRGTRSFAVDKLGRLTGVTYPQVWTPGENQAVCRKEEGGLYVSLQRLTGFYQGAYPNLGRTTVISTYSPPASPPKRTWMDKVIGSAHVQETVEKFVEDQAARAEAEREAEEQARREAEEAARRDTLANCPHGFYGYYDGSNDYYRHGYVMGVVEGYGETVIGTRGFRCMKARIVALRLPKHVDARLRALVTRNYEGIPVFDTFKAMIAAYPPDDAGSGYTPEHPDFWTREV